MFSRLCGSVEVMAVPTVIALSLSLSLVCHEPGEREPSFLAYFPQDVTRCDDSTQAGGHCKYTSRSHLTYPSPPYSVATDVARTVDYYLPAQENNCEAAPTSELTTFRGTSDLSESYSHSTLRYDLAAPTKYPPE